MDIGEKFHRINTNQETVHYWETLLNDSYRDL